MDNQERLNALSRAAMIDLTERFIDANNDPDVLAVVLTGAGDRAFSAGGDLKAMHEQAQAGARLTHPMERLQRNLFEVVWETYKPTFAAINGYAVGGGFELALACDIRIASTTAKFGLPEVKRGMGANFGSVLLPRMIPRGIAMEMLYTGDVYPAEACHRWGLINHLVAPDELMAETEKLVRRILANAPLTLARYKNIATKGFELPVPTALRLNVGPDPYTSADRREGAAAFVEKRPPGWTRS